MSAPTRGHDGLPHAEHRPHCQGRRDVHRLRMASRAARPVAPRSSLGQEPFRTGLLTIGMPGAPHGIADWTPTIADAAQAAGLHDRPVRQEPSRRPGRAPADGARLRRVLRQPLPPQRRGGAGGLFLSEGSGVPKEVRPARRDQARRSGRQDRGHRAAEQEAHGDVDEEFLAAAKDFIDRQDKASKPFFCWFNSTRMHIFTH